MGVVAVLAEKEDGIDVSGAAFVMREKEAERRSGLEEKARKLSQILYVLAEMTAGMDVEDPAAFAEQVAELF